jgi:hypothetical protein
VRRIIEQALSDFADVVDQGIDGMARGIDYLTDPIIVEGALWVAAILFLAFLTGV